MGRTPGAKDKKKRKSREDRGEPGWSKNPIIMENMKIDAPKGYNAKKIQFLQKILPPSKLDRSDKGKMVEEMEKRFENYLYKCAEEDVKVGNMAAYLAIGITKADVYDWTHLPNIDPRLTDFAKKIQTICGYYRENLMQDGKINPATGIFWQKNYDGLKDQQDVVVTPNNPLGDTTDPEQLKQKYIENTYGIAELPEQKGGADAPNKLIESSEEISEK